MRPVWLTGILITGNVSVAIAPVIAWCYFKPDASSRDRLAMVISSLVLLFWVVLSGTRGYILNYGFFLIPILLHFCIGKKPRSQFEIFVFVGALAIVVALEVFMVEHERIVSALTELLFRSDTPRAGDSLALGVRGQENSLMRDFMFTTSAQVRAFGIGLGGTFADYSEFALAAWANGIPNYINASGASFHNYYSVIWSLQGAFGLVVTLMTFAWVLYGTARSAARNAWLRACLVLYAAGFFIALMFRWSTSCGITEMLVFAAVLNLAREKKDPETSRSTIAANDLKRATGK